MWQNFTFSVNCVMPIFIILIVGFVLKQTGIIDDYAIQKINGIVFNAAIPVMLFRDISGSDFTEYFDIKLVVFSIVTTLIICGVTWFTANQVMKDKREAGAFVQGCFRGNYAIIGLPLISNILGNAQIGKGTLITTFIVPLYNLLAVIVLTFNSYENTNRNETVIKACKNIIKNPLIIGIVCGLPFSLLHISFPAFINTSVNYMSNLATPLALIAIGGSISFKKIKPKFLKALLTALIKLVITPLVFIPIAILLNFAGEALVVLYVMYATPTAVSSYVMACNMGADGDLAANIVLFTTLLSIISFTAGIYIFKTLGLI